MSGREMHEGDEKSGRELQKEQQRQRRALLPVLDGFSSTSATCTASSDIRGSPESVIRCGIIIRPKEFLENVVRNLSGAMNNK